MTTFNPVDIATKIVLRCVSRKPCHFSLAVESVRLSDVAMLVGAYDIIQKLIDSGKLVISKNDILSTPQNKY